MRIRPATLDDVPALSDMMHALWPDGPREEHELEARAAILGATGSPVPLVLLVAEVDHALAGFAEVSMRSVADGCDFRQPVGYLEGWYVRPEARRTGVGRQLLAAAESWAVERGAIEFASDALIDNDVSIAAHQALGFEIVDRCVHFRKRLRATSDELNEN